MAMIDVPGILRALPHFENFCSVRMLHRFVEHLRADKRFEVEVAGTSVNGLPIHHVRVGKGSVKALIVGGPHAMEPIGSLTVFGLMNLLSEGNRYLLDTDVEWNIVPCIDPDSAILNEGWTQKPFTLDNYMRNFYLQPPKYQVDSSFPIRYKKLVWNEMSHEASILKRILEQVSPDFYFPLHSAWVGGAWFFLSRDIDHKFHGELYDLLAHERLPVQKRPIWEEFCRRFGEGIIEINTRRRQYDYLERTSTAPERFLAYGAQSWSYLEEIKPSALTFVAEMGHVRHPNDESDLDTGENLRKFKLTIDADIKYLATVILTEWERVKEDVDKTNPIYDGICNGWVLPERDGLLEGGIPISWYPTRDTLFNPEYDRTMTERDRFKACMVDGGFIFARFSYQCVRLLKASRQTPAIKCAIERLDLAFDEALRQIGRHVDFSQFEAIQCDTLARVQLGSGLIVLNSLL